MVCTNDDELYEYMKLFRSHGMTRETSPKFRERYEKEYPELNPLFTFAVPAINMRNTEFNAVVGLSQIKRLDTNISLRQHNLNVWLDNLDPKIFYTNFDSKGSSNFSLPLIVRPDMTEEDKEGLMGEVCEVLEEEKIEYRVGTAGGGNQTLQPYLKSGKYEYRIHDHLDNTNHIHDYGLYIGNHTELTEQQVINLCDQLASTP